MSDRHRPWPLVVRRARAGDGDAVLAFASATWDGWDYMPHAWPRWLDDGEGVMLVATGPSGTPVAVVRVAVPAPGEAWLEGIRVDPAVRGMDVATDLQVAELHWAAASGARIVRYATSARNEGSHRLGARGGFEHVATLMSCWWAPGGMNTGHENDDPSGFLPEVQEDARRRRRALLAKSSTAEASEAGTLWRLVDVDESFNAAQRLYEPRPWAMEELTEAKFVEHVRRGEVMVRAGVSATALAILVADVAPAEDAALRFALLSGDSAAAFELLEEARATAGEALRFRYATGAPLIEAVADRYRAGGYAFSDWALHIMSRPIDAEHPLPEVDPVRLTLLDRPVAI